MSTIELRNVDKLYGTVKAVDNISFTLADREFLALLGPSGCGKTTTLRMLGGFIRPTSGQILIDGRDVTDVPPERRPTAMVFQNYALWPHMTVLHNVTFGLRLRKMAPAAAEQQARAILATVGLDGVDERYPGQLSGGQQQRVALARALVLQPKILLLDEPLSNLDAKLRVRMRDEIRRIQQDFQITTIYVTHDQEEALTMADRIVVMHRGRIQQMGNAVEIYEQPQTPFVADFIGVSSFYEGVLERDATGDVVACIGDVRLDVTPVDVGPGDRVTVSIRPEDVEILPLSDGTDARSFALSDPRLVNFGAYKRLIAHNPSLGAVEARVEKDFAVDGRSLLCARVQRARAFAAGATAPVQTATYTQRASEPPRRL